MNTKLTLRMDQTLIARAKQYADEHGASLSQLVAEYFAVLTANQEAADEFEDQLPPITRSLVGILDQSRFDAAEYRRYQEEKYA